MFRAYAFLVRTSYIMTATLALLGATWLLIELGQSFVSRGASNVAGEKGIEGLVVVAIVLVYLAPSMRAFARLLFCGELIPDSHLAERPVVASLVFLSCGGGTVLIALVAWALLVSCPSRGTSILAVRSC